MMGLVEIVSPSLAKGPVAAGPFPFYQNPLSERVFKSDIVGSQRGDTEMAEAGSKLWDRHENGGPCS